MQTGARLDPSRLAALDDISHDAANSPESNRDLICKREFSVGDSMFHAVSCRCYCACSIAEFSLLRVHRSYGLLRPLLEFRTGEIRKNPTKIPTRTSDQQLRIVWEYRRMTCPPQVWDGVLRRLAHELSPLALSAWITPIHAEVNGLVLRLSCPSAFHRDRVRERFLTRIEELVSEEADEPMQVALEVGAPQRAFGPLVTAATAEDAHSVALTRRAAPVVVRAPEHRSRSIALAPEPQPLRPRPDLPQHTFASFVVGPGNALAREACVALAQGRQLAMSPLYLVAPDGQGKTHLAAAVVAEARENSSARVVSASGEQFTNELLAAIRANRTAEFKARYRRDCDLLVLEDIQFVGGKRQTQLELLHTLESLAQRGARVLLTAERLPKEIPDLDPRLASRMASGLCAEIEAPDTELRRAILRTKAAAGGVRLPPGALERLVSVPGSVRDLEAVLIQLVASASLLKRAIDLDLVESALRKMLPRLAAQGLDSERVVETVATAFQTTPTALASRTRRRDVLVPRQLAMYLCTRYTDASMQRIGQLFGRNHPSVANAVRAVERGLLERAPLRYKVEALIARLDTLAGKPTKSAKH
jgi:chromosomal replication initiator protein